jgi:hypothetical protein
MNKQEIIIWICELALIVAEILFEKRLFFVQLKKATNGSSFLVEQKKEFEKRL